MRFRALTLIAKGYALALVLGMVLAASGIGELHAILLAWIAGAVLTLCVAAFEWRIEHARVVARVPVFPHQRRRT